MKYRQGFVSNSSSSSFVIVGKKIDGNLKDAMIKANPQAVKKWLSEQQPNEYYDHKELHEDQVMDCWYDTEGDYNTLVHADEKIYEGIKISFDENGYCDEEVTELDDLPIGSKLYTGTEQT